MTVFGGDVTGRGRVAAAVVAGTTVAGAAAVRRALRPPRRPSLGADEWANWSRNQRARPARVGRPESVEDLRNLVMGGPGPVRPVGAGHSFTGLVPTDGTIVSLDHLSGLVEVDVGAATAWVRAGTRLRDLSPALAEYGLALPNLGDIDAQSVAGAVSTATHGTGARLPCLSGQVIGIRLLTADGRVHEATRSVDADLLQAAAVSLGALGVLVDVQLQLRDRFRLRRRTWVSRTDTTLATAIDRWDAHRHFEFFAVPFADRSVCIAHDETDRPSTPPVASTDDQDLLQLKLARDVLWRVEPARRAVLRMALDRVDVTDRVGESWRLLPSPRGVFFHELEYHLPVDRGLDALEESLAWMERHRRDAWFVVECRQTAGDRAWMSPFGDGSRISIAVHAFASDDHTWLLTGIEPILRRHGGRPHWGKLHTLDRRDVLALYPRAGDFLALRDRLDPQGRFLNDHLRRLLVAAA